MASTDIAIAYARQFSDNIMLRAQQKDARLLRTAQNAPVSHDKQFSYFDRMSPTEMVEKTQRHPDTPNLDMVYDRRAAVATTWHWGKLYDWDDLVRMMSDPRSKAVLNAVSARNRRIDRTIIAALGGPALDVAEGLAHSSVDLPASQKIAVGGTGMTLAKLLEAKERLDAAEVDDEGDPRYCVHSSRQLRELLNTTEIKNADYNTIKALAQGQINTFLGFEFIRTQLLPLSATNVRSCYFYTQQAIGYDDPIPMESRVSERNDKSHAWQAYVAQRIGATRVEDEQVVEVACDEPPAV